MEGLPVQLAIPLALPAALKVPAPRVNLQRLYRANTRTFASALGEREQCQLRFILIVRPVIQVVLRVKLQETPICV